MKHQSEFVNRAEGLMAPRLDTYRPDFLPGVPTRKFAKWSRVRKYFVKVRARRKKRLIENSSLQAVLTKSSFRIGFPGILSRRH
jgi:hypothetical protein